MRFFEIALLLLGALLPFVISSKKVNVRMKLLLGLILATVVLHFAIEGFRWQMFPIYLINIILMISLLKDYKYFKGKVFRKVVSGFFLFLLLGLGFAFSSILPVFDLPSPTGSYEIGSQYLHYISDQDEPITEMAGDKRELMVKVWYPAVIEEEKREAYFDQGERIGFAAKYGLPKNTFNYLDKVKTNTFTNPQIAEGKFPVLVFSHGYNSNATGYYALVEEIVSHGYIVLNINHTYESAGSLFPSGEVKLYDVAFDRKHNTGEMATMIWDAMEKYRKAGTKEERSEAITGTLKNYVAAGITHRWADDINQIVDQIPIWQKTTFLTNHMDTAKIGVLGHSQGAAAAGEALLDNSRISAGMSIDGTQWGNMVDTFHTKPYILLTSDLAEDHPDFNEIAFQNGSTSDFYLGKIKGAGHSSFMDIPFMIRLSLINEAGDIDPEKAIEITSKVVIGFFDKYLKDNDKDLLNLGEEYPELEIELLEKQTY